MKKNVCKQNFIKAVALIATLAYGLAASAATYTWNPTTQGVWSTADGYWSPAPLVSANTNDVVMKTRFLTAIGLAYTIRSLTFDNGGNSQTFNLNNSNAGNTGRTLTFESDSGNSTLTVNATATGNYTIQSLTGGRGRILLTSSLDIVHNGSGTLSLGGGATDAYISGAGSISKSGSGLVVFDGRNTYTGTTTVSAGTLKLGTVGLLGNGTYSKDISISSGAVLEYASSATQTLAGAVSGAGALVMSGTGLLTLSGTNTYTGTTTVSSGTLSLSHTNALPVTMDVYLTTGTGVNVNLSEGTHVIRRLYLDNKLYFKGVLNASNVPGGLLTGTGSFFCTEGNPRGTLISFF